MLKLIFSKKIFLFFNFKKFFIFFWERGGTLPLDSPGGSRWENENLSHRCFLRKHFLKYYLSLVIYFICI